MCIKQWLIYKTDKLHFLMIMINQSKKRSNQLTELPQNLINMSIIYMCILTCLNNEYLYS